MPHVDWTPTSLWWYRAGADYSPTEQSKRVIDAYLEQCARGRALPKDFKDDLLRWLRELTRPQKISPRRKKFWSLPAYALAHKLPRGAFLKRFREMEKIAARLYPERLPQDNIRKPMLEKQKHKIVCRYLEVARGHSPDYPFDVHRDTIRVLAGEFDIPSFRIGQLCRAARATVTEERNQIAATPATPMKSLAAELEPPEPT
jgi:hypothetical protein